MGTLVYSPPWRWVVTTRHSVVLSFLDRLASKRSCVYTLNKPATATGEVPSDVPEVNIVHDDGDPYLEEGDRLLWCFRRETRADSSSAPWVPRFAGPILQVNDIVRGDQPVTAFTAMDPWQVLFKRPIRLISGALPGRTGFTYPNTRGSTIALELLRNTIATDGDCYLDAGVDWGGTAFYGGTLEETSRLDFTLQSATTVGEAWQKLAETGTLDIVLTPVWDPINRPGICCEVNIYEIAGSRRNGAIFAWDQPSRSLVGVDRLADGTQRKNVVQPYLQEGIPGTEVVDTASIAKYGTFWDGPTIPGVTTFAELEALAAESVLIDANGSETIRVNPAANRSPVPFVEYFLGDSVPVYASKRLRKAINAGAITSAGAWSNLQRVYSIPIDIGDDNTETVRELEFSADSTTSSPSPPPESPPPPVPPPETGTLLWEWISPDYTLGIAGSDHWFGEVSDGGPEDTTIGPALTTVSDGAGGYATRMAITEAGTINGSGGILTALAEPMPTNPLGAPAWPNGQITSGAYTLVGQDIWYRTQFRFPSSGLYHPVTGGWNIVVEWHQEYYGVLPGVAQYPSPCVCVHTDGSTGANGINPRLAFRFRSGLNYLDGPLTQIDTHYLIDELTAATVGLRGTSYNDDDVAGPNGSLGGGTIKPLQFDHWYDVLIHWNWDLTDGVCEWWVDGVQQFSISGVPTVYTYGDGNYYPHNFGIYNYRYALGTATLPSYVDHRLVSMSRA